MQSHHAQQIPHAIEKLTAAFTAIEGAPNTPHQHRLTQAQEAHLNLQPRLIASTLGC
jgi:hypothetical protein